MFIFKTPAFLYFVEFKKKRICKYSTKNITYLLEYHSNIVMNKVK